jgi:hypothetical protein
MSEWIPACYDKRSLKENNFPENMHIAFDN